MSLINRVGLGRALTHAEVDGNFAYLLGLITNLSGGGTTTTPPPAATTNLRQYLVIGDSLEGCNETDGNPEGDYYSPLRWSIVMRNKLANGIFGDFRNFGRSGYTLDQLVPYQANALAQKNPGAYPGGSVFMCGGGINNLLITSDTAQQVYDKKVAWFQAAINAGFEVRTQTLTNAYTNDPAGTIAKITEVNRLLRLYASANSGTIGLYDFASDVQLNDTQDVTNGVHAPNDPIHFGEKGNEIKAKIAKNVEMARRAGQNVAIGATPQLSYNATDNTLLVTSPYDASFLLLSTNAGRWLPMSSKTIANGAVNRAEGYYRVAAATTDAYNCSAVAISQAIAITVAPPAVTTYAHNDGAWDYTSGTFTVNGDMAYSLGHPGDIARRTLPTTTSKIVLRHARLDQFHTIYTVRYQGNNIGSVNLSAHGGDTGVAIQFSADVPGGGGLLELIEGSANPANPGAGSLLVIAFTDVTK